MELSAIGTSPVGDVGEEDEGDDEVEEELRGEELAVDDPGGGRFEEVDVVEFDGGGVKRSDVNGMGC